MTRAELEAIIKDTVGTEVARKIEENRQKGLENPAPPVTWWADLQKALTTKDPVEAVKVEKGLMVGAAILAYAGAMHAKQSPEYALKLLEARGPAHKDMAAKIADARAKAVSAGDPLAGGFLIPDEFSSDIIELLRPASAVRFFNPPTVPTAAGTLRVPRITEGSSGYYIGENANITPSQPRFGQLTLSYKKLAALVPISNDFLRRPTIGGDALVRNDMVRAMAHRENQAFLRDTGTEATPKGLRYWVDAGNVIAANVTISAANTATDLSRLILKLEENNIPMSRVGWILAPRVKQFLMTQQTTVGAFIYRDEMVRGTLWGWPFRSTTVVPTNLTDHGGSAESEIYLTDFDEAVIGETERLIVDASNEAAYWDGSQVVSAFSQDQSVVRTIQEHDFAMRRNTAVAVMNGVNWGV